MLRNGLAYDDGRLMDALHAHQVTWLGPVAGASAPASTGADLSLRDQGSRRLTYALDLLDQRIWGERPFGFHLTNLLLHLLV